jgi:hypothetical protein
MPPRTKPKPKTEPAAEPDEVEAPDVVAVEFNGYTFTIPRVADEWSTVAELARIHAITYRTVEAWLGFIKELVGPDQWEVVTTVAATKRSDLYAFVGKICDAVQEQCEI